MHSDDELWLAGTQTSEDFQATAWMATAARVQSGCTRFSIHDGFISQGGDLWRAVMTVETAKQNASQIPGCKGFCFRGPDTGEAVEIFFKAKWDNQAGETPWTSYKCEEEAIFHSSAPSRAPRPRSAVALSKSSNSTAPAVLDALVPYRERPDRVPYLQGEAEHAGQLQGDFDTTWNWPRVPRERAEQDGCLFWEVMLIKEGADETFGLTVSDGQLYFEERLVSWRCSHCASGPNGLPPCPNCPRTFPINGARVSGPSELIVWGFDERGALERWNRSVSPLSAVEPGDRILEVNGERSIDGMLQQIARSQRVCLFMKRYPEVFSVSFAKDEFVFGRGLGFRCPLQCHCPGRRLESLIITELLPSGIVPDYNARQAKPGGWQNVLLQGMEIESVNGVSGDAQAMAEELRTWEGVTLHVRRAEKAKNLHVWNCIAANCHEVVARGGVT
jgi:hypothetical protein